MSDNLADLIHENLQFYSNEIRAGIEKEVNKSMTKLVKNTKRDAPERTGRYKNAISSRKTIGTSGEYAKHWYVKAPYYRLTHLLNNGHAKRGGGRVNGDNHISDNEKEIVREFEQAVKEVIRNSGR